MFWNKLGSFKPALQFTVIRQYLIPVCKSDGAGVRLCVFGSHDGVMRKPSTE